MRNMIKIVILLLVALCSLEVASGRINQLVKEVEAREKTLTDAIVKKQVEQTFKEVEKQIEEVAKAENIEIQTEKVEMKPSIVEKEKSKETKQAQEETVPEETETVVSEIEIEEALEVVKGEIVEEVPELTGENLIVLGEYLVENYFLDGYIYYTSETDPEKFERKKLTHEMESYVIKSLVSVVNIITDIRTINEETIGLILDEAVILAEEFEEIFKGIDAQGEEFILIYQEIEEYFKQYIGTLEQINTSLKTISNAPNPALVLTIVTKELNEVIIPGMKAVMNAGFELKEKTNEIYMEGIQDKQLLTKQEVIEIISNPEILLDKPNEEVEEVVEEVVEEIEEVEEVEEIKEVEEIEEVEEVEEEIIEQEKGEVNTVEESENKLP